MPRIYYRNKRTKEQKAFYSTAQWRRMRIAYLSENPYCVFCERNDETKLADTVDHVIPISVNWDLRFDWDNLRSLCKECHDNMMQLTRDKLPPRTFSDGSPNPEFRKMWDLYNSQKNLSC